VKVHNDELVCAGADSALVRIDTPRWHTAKVAAAMIVLCLLGALADAADPSVAYDIEVLFDPVGHRLTATQTLRWVNTASVATDEIWLHLYLNAFAHGNTTALADIPIDDGEPWQWIAITKMSTPTGQDLLAGLEFIRPDDGNPRDYTLARVPLPDEVLPSASITLEMEFVVQLGQAMLRSGYVGDFFLVAQWYPKIAVYEDVGVRGRTTAGWSTHQYHGVGEFYGEFADYDVTITLPEEWIVASSGVEVRRGSDGSGAGAGTTVVFRANNVHDFAWAVAPSSLMTSVEAEFEPARDVPAQWLEQAQELLGVSAVTLELPPLHLRLMMPRSQQHLSKRMLDSARLAVAWCGLRYGPYPYPQLTIVSPPAAARRSVGGMEYPTLIVTGAHPLEALLPRYLSQSIEEVTVHEFAHQYFYGILATNEVEEAWLDEGLAQYSEASCLAAIAKLRLLGEGPVIGPWTNQRLWLARSTTSSRPAQPSFKFRSTKDYALASYERTALALHTFEGLYGNQALAKGLRSYVKMFAFSHPSGTDLIAALSDACGEDVSWFFDQAVYGDAMPDWVVLDVSNRRVEPERGYAWEGATWTAVNPDPPENPRQWKVQVDVGRRGEFVGPVEVEVRFADGQTQRWRWQGQERWKRWVLTSTFPVTQVIIDPDGAWALEVSRADNYWRAHDGVRLLRHPLWWLGDSFRLIRLACFGWL